MNLGDHVGDGPHCVAANRAALQASTGAQPVFLSQVHGTEVVWLGRHSAHGTVADASVTDQPGMACTIMVADCLPVLFTNGSGTLVAAAHAGWRSLLGQNGQGVLEAVVKRFEVPAPPVVPDVIAWLGPCIGPQAFEVGDEVRAAFGAAAPQALDCFKPKGPGKWLADLPALARQRLQRLGITQVFGNDGRPAWCTVSQPSRFFSYRRDGVSGRMAACIWLD
jgi:YfiH family protein